MNKIELLSPVGSIGSLRAAVENGADSVYMGLNNFNARTMANNFSMEEYIEAIKYCHIKGVKVFLTLNTLVYDDEIEEALKECITLYENGLDAVIVQDYGIASVIRKIMPDLPIHASTQMSIHSLKQIKFLEKLGFKRVVLARELSVEQIESICNNTSMEVEVFIHGALCVCYSGQCLMSSMIGSRSGNRGSCAQPCRMKYSLIDEENNVIEKDKYLLSKKDIYGIDYIGRLKNAGVSSIKIEGRNKIPEYVATVTSMYRKCLDGEKLSKEDKNDLLQIFNRSGKSSGYFDGVTGKETITERTPKNTGLKLGKVIGQKGKFINVSLLEDIDMHDGIEIYNGITVSTIVTCIKNDEGKIINGKVAKGTSVWLGDIAEKIRYGSEIYKTSSDELNKRLRYTFENENSNIRKNKLEVKMIMKINEKIKVEAISLLDGKKISYITETIPEQANQKAISKEIIEQAFSKTVEEPFIFEKLDLDIEDDLFVSMASLNNIRKEILEKMKQLYIIKRDVTKVNNALKELINQMSENGNAKKVNSIYLYKYDDNKDYTKELDGIERIYFEVSDIIKNKWLISKYSKKYEIYIAIPNVVEANLEKFIDKNIIEILNSKINGVLLGNVGYIEQLATLKEKYNIKLVADYSLNIMNSFSARFFEKLGVDIITLSPEMTDEQILKMSDRFNVEVISDNVTVMTSRYCMIGSFVGGKKLDSKCNRACTKAKYYIKDTKAEIYQIKSDNIDSIMKIIKKYQPNYSENVIKKISIRKNIV